MSVFKIFKPTRFGNASYALHDMMEDTRKGLFSELTTQKPQMYLEEIYKRPM